MLQTTLAIMIENWKIFLWEKKKGFAKWVLNWVWWKQDKWETIEECMIREAKEEIGINITKKDLEYLGVLHFYFDDKEMDQDVYLYNIKKYSWNIVESNEIKPYWFDLNAIPYNKMWEDDIIWLPRVLKWEKNIEYDFFFDKDNWKMSKYKLIK